jgi:hypothetical protein
MDCVFLDDGYCSAAAVEIDPDMGCMTYSRDNDLDGDGDWEDNENDLDSWDDMDVDDDDLWLTEDEY